MGLAGCRNQRFFEENLVNQAVNVSANKSALVNGRSGVKVREKLALLKKDPRLKWACNWKAESFFAPGQMGSRVLTLGSS